MKCMIIVQKVIAYFVFLCIFFSCKEKVNNIKEFKLPESHNESQVYLKTNFDFVDSIANTNDHLDNYLNGHLCFYKAKQELLKGNAESALDLFNRALVNFTEIEHKESLGYTYYYISKINFDKGLLRIGINNALNGIDLFEQINDHLGSCYLFILLGNNLAKNDNYNSSINYYENAAVLASRIDNKKLLRNIQFNQAGLYLLNDKCYESLELYNKVEKSNVLTNKERNKIYNNKAHIFRKLGVLDSAYYYYQICLKRRLKERDSTGLAIIWNNLLSLYIQNGQLKKANAAYEELNQLELLIPKSEKYKSMLNKYYIKLLNTGNEQLIMEHKDLGAYQDSLSNAAFSDKLIDMQKSFELKEKDREIALLEKEDALNQAHLKTKNILIAVAVGFVVVLLIVAYLINRQRRELVQSRKRLLRQKEDITGMNEQLRVSNLAKDRILSVIGHDLRGPVGGLKELIELYMELPEYEPNDIENLLKAARESSTSTYHLLENLLSWANSQRGDIEFKPMATPLAPLIKHSVKLLDKSINTRRIKFTFDIPETLVVQVDMNMLRTIIRNLVSNAIKYSPEHGEVRIEACPKDNSIHLCISDNGSGMTGEEAQSIFHKKETYFIGSEFSAKGTGLGLILCKEFVERHSGRIWIESQKGAGTTVCFSLPHSQKIGQNIVIENAFSN